MNINDVIELKKEAENHLINELLPFWTTRMKDEINGGYLTHFDKDDEDFGGDYASVSIFVNGKEVITYGDHYHEKGRERAEAFIEGLEYALDVKAKITQEKIADWEY